MKIAIISGSHRKNSQSAKVARVIEKTLLDKSVVFLIGGYETTSSTLSFATHLLAKHRQQQQRLRQELQEVVKEHGSITYQGVKETKYLDACLNGE